MSELPMDIRKHWIGYIAIFGAGLLIVLLVWWGLDELLYTQAIDPILAMTLAALLIGSTVIVTVIQLVVYGLSFLKLTTDGIQMRNYYTLFYVKNEAFEWVRVSRATYKRDRGAIFAQAFDYGSIEIETNGGHVPARISMMPNPEALQETIQRWADNATP